MPEKPTVEHPPPEKEQRLSGEEALTLARIERKLLAVQGHGKATTGHPKSAFTEGVSQPAPLARLAR
ncbi:MAG TPA: hypothetical protein VND98_06225 [Solirubrobacterales bacterium]|nr:hypothetical protein [Solirubrobacterales bacterium]